VIAEIQIGDTTTNINIQITQFSRWATTDFQPAENNDLEIHRSQLIEINGIDLFTTNSLFTNVLFYDTNGLYISNITQTSSFSPPTNAIYMGFNADNRSGFSNRISLSQFQSLTLSYSAPGATTTFYDSYPGGNVIGTTNGTQIGGISSTVTPQIINNFWGAHNDGSIFSASNFNVTEPIPVPNNITINNHQFVSTVLVYNESTYIGGFWSNNQFSNDPKYLGIITENIVLPQNSTHIRLGNSISNSTWSPNASLANFQTVTVSLLEPGYLQIDPPTGKRIKQIALKGL
jgi:hypothetical protein